MAGSTTANKNRCVQMTKKTPATTGGAATKGGATSKRASAGGSARRPATATNKSTRAGGKAATTSPRRVQKKGGSFDDAAAQSIDDCNSQMNEMLVEVSKIRASLTTLQEAYAIQEQLNTRLNEENKTLKENNKIRRDEIDELKKQIEQPNSRPQNHGQIIRNPYKPPIYERRDDVRNGIHDPRNHSAIPSNYNNRNYIKQR